MPPKPRQIKLEQKSALASMQALESRTDEELRNETRFRSAAQAILGARAAERYDAKAARAHFQPMRRWRWPSAGPTTSRRPWRSSARLRRAGAS